MSEMSIDFGALTGGAPPAAGAADSALAGVADQLLHEQKSGTGELRIGGESAADVALPGQAPGQFSCLAMLSATQQEQARSAGKQLFPKMLNNTDLMAEFGNQAIDAVNMQVNRIFRELGPVEIPELTAMMKQINDTMRSFRKRYDPNAPDVREAFDRFMDSVRGVFRRGRDFVEMLFEESRTVEQQLDRIAGQLVDKQRELKRNVVLCDELYRANEQSISQLVGAIAVMETIRDEAAQALQGIVIDPADPDKRDKEELRNRIAEFIQAMEVRVNEFQQRLFVAWSTSPQVRNTRTLHYGLGQRLALLVNLTIPTMKLTIAQWALLLQAQQAAEMQQAVADGANDVLQAYAQASGRTVGEVARTIQTPTLRPETILEVATSLDQQAESMIDAVKYGHQARQDVVNALIAAQHSISQSSDKLAGTVAELVTKAEEPLALPAIPQLPDAVLEQSSRLAQPAQR
ncbi:toxic anion resistance protein [Raineyella sp. W15-4]|uniref:toxic anion resistance protein n=1 Tax=Raineyella sp. W15-4 TaxID=3081651 RepID=UPI00295537FA|nr:toxic anion resistance protein [Raineyella sp. W15-4]WOQ17956.1 toxic anion resistance protein [Raineyella sp. W15-4]